MRELIHRTFGVTDDEHPYIKLLLAPGKDFAVGGEVNTRHALPCLAVSLPPLECVSKPAPSLPRWSC